MAASRSPGGSCRPATTRTSPRPCCRARRVDRQPGPIPGSCAQSHPGDVSPRCRTVAADLLRRRRGRRRSRLHRIRAHGLHSWGEAHHRQASMPARASVDDVLGAINRRVTIVLIDPPSRNISSSRVPRPAQRVRNERTISAGSVGRSRSVSMSSCTELGAGWGLQSGAAGAADSDPSRAAASRRRHPRRRRSARGASSG